MAENKNTIDGPVILPGASETAVGEKISVFLIGPQRMRNADTLDDKIAFPL